MYMYITFVCVRTYVHYITLRYITLHYVTLHYIKIYIYNYNYIYIYIAYIYIYYLLLAYGSKKRPELPRLRRALSRDLKDQG